MASHLGKNWPPIKNLMGGLGGGASEGAGGASGGAKEKRKTKISFLDFFHKKKLNSFFTVIYFPKNFYPFVE